MKTWLRKICIVAGIAAAFGAHASALQDATIKIDRPVNSPTLTVRYSGVKVALIELKVNGKSVNTRVVNADQTSGESAFSLDTEALAEGENEVEALLFDANGKQVGRQTSTIKMAHKGDAAVYLEGVKSGGQIKGTVEMKLGLNREFRDIYVSFFVDDEWRSLRNTAPYSYYWDTTRHTNGWHEVQAWVVDEANNTFKTQKVKVYVNNPGGRTERVEDPTKTNTVAPKAPETPKVAVNTQPRINVTAPLTLDTTPINGTVSNSTGLRNVPVNAQGVATGAKTLTPTGKRNAAAPVAKPEVKKPEPQKIALTNEVKKPEPAKVFTPTVKPLPEKIALSAPTTDIVKINFGTRLNPGTKLNISYMGKAVIFPDVQPRVNVQGIALTPFRHLFQQAGCEVNWLSKEKGVSAKGLGQDIKFWIGNPNAKINNETIKMEVKPGLEKGRSIVPVSFVQKALKVNVEVDKKSGHVLITNAGK